MEIEAKFRASDDSVFAAFRQLTSLGPFQLRAAPQPERQENTYFDTADRRLRAQHYGLRVRRIESRRIATLKGPAVIHDGLHSRGEWETDVPGDDIAGWPAGELRERVFALLGEQPLQPILSISTNREHIYASHDGVQVAEISLDQGMFHAGTQHKPFSEIEIELLDDRQAEFEELVQLLRKRFALEPEPRSKLERGLALYEQQ